MDVSLAGFPLERQIIDRATPFSFDKRSELLTCSAEDLVVLKAFADRGRDWSDIEGILIRQQGKLDWPLIESSLAPLAAAKEQPDLVDKLLALRDTLDAPP